MRPQDTEIWQQMMSGEPYDALNEVLLEELNRTRVKVSQYNAIRPDDTEAREAAIRELLGGCGRQVNVVQPFYCDYGCNIVVGEKFFANYGLMILDEARVEIGDNVFIGPNVGIYTACHPTDPIERNSGVEWSLPVKIGNNCWIGGGAIIVPGVTIGDGVTIGAGAVVTKDVPPGEVWAGNPARKIKEI